MNKIFTIFCVVATFLVISCDDDYKEVVFADFNNNFKALQKIDSSGVNNATFKYNDQGILQTATLQEDTLSVINMVYDNGNLMQMIIDPTSVNRREVDFYYDNAGKIIQAQEVVYENDAKHIFINSELIYTGGKLQGFTRKRKSANYPVANYYEEVMIEYSGDNIKKITENYGTITNGLLLPPSGSIIHEFENHDNKKSALRTLPIQYVIGLGTVSTRHLEGISHNNAQTKKVSKSDGSVLHYTPVFTYSYDAQNFPTGSQPGNTTYTYIDFSLE